MILSRGRSLLLKHRTKLLSRGMSSAASEDGEIIMEKSGNAGLITLNRPKALNALNLNMIRQMYPTLKEWETDPNIGVIVIKGAGPKAFCAGGDVRAIAEEGKSGGELPKVFFKEEYWLNNLIGNLKTPYVALISGITMGGGVGLSVHGHYRVASEKTLFAMPETAIGLFPDVGGGYFLPRLQGKLGLFLSLTGFRLKGRDVFHSGVATHYVAHEKIPLLEEEVLSLQNPSNELVQQVLQSYHKQSEDPAHEFCLNDKLESIDRLFSHESLEQIYQALQDEATEWSLQQHQTLSKMCPISMKITMRQLQEGAQMNLGDVLKMEYRLTQRCMEDEDFYEGIRAMLIDRDNSPRWSHSEPADVPKDLVDRYFSMLSEERELTFE